VDSSLCGIVDNDDDDDESSMIVDSLMSSFDDSLSRQSIIPFVLHLLSLHG